MTHTRFPYLTRKITISSRTQNMNRFVIYQFSTLLLRPSVISCTNRYLARTIPPPQQKRKKKGNYGNIRSVRLGYEFFAPPNRRLLASTGMRSLKRGRKGEGRKHRRDCMSGSVYVCTLLYHHIVLVLNHPHLSNHRHLQQNAYRKYHQQQQYHTHQLISISTVLKAHVSNHHPPFPLTTSNTRG